MFTAVTNGNIIFPLGGPTGLAGFSPQKQSLFLPLTRTLIPRPLNLKTCIRTEIEFCPVGIREDKVTGKTCGTRSIIGKVDDD